MLSTNNITSIYKVTSITKDNIAKLKHWKQYPNQKLLVPCRGCTIDNINVESTQSSCQLHIEATSAIQLRVSKTKKLYSDIEEITSFLQNRKVIRANKQANNRTKTNIIYSDKKTKKNLELINDTISETNIQNKLLGIYTQTRHSKYITTILSTKIVEDTSTETKYLVAYWSILDTDLNLSVKTSIWPSKVHALLIAVITIMLILLTEYKLTLVTSSQQIQRLVNILADSNHNTRNELLKQKEWPLWLMIYTLYHKKQLKVTMEIPNNQYNNKLISPLEVTLNLDQARHDTYYLQWHNNIIIHQPRRFI